MYARNLVLPVLATMLTACGGGGGGAPTSPAMPAPGANDEQAPAPETDPALEESRDASPPADPPPSSTVARPENESGELESDRSDAGEAPAEAPSVDPRRSSASSRGAVEYSGALPRVAERYSAPATLDPAGVGTGAEWEDYNRRAMSVYMPPWGSRDPNRYLTDARIDSIQPGLATIGAHHAYARGYSGRGVTIAISDDGVDINAEAFTGRVQDRGSEHTYSRPFAFDESFGVFDHCLYTLADCAVFEIDAGGDNDRVQDFARHIVRRLGYPTRDDSWYIRDTSQADVLAWHEIPALHEEGIGGYERGHGTQVASAALGWGEGVAPGATLLPLAVNFDEQWELDTISQLVVGIVDGRIEGPAGWSTDEFDTGLAETAKADMSHYDIINFSYGVPSYSTWGLANRWVDAAAGEAWIRDNLPDYWGVWTQRDIPAADRVLRVFAAGNEAQVAPGADASAPYRIPALRGLAFAVAALDADGDIARFSNRCGPLPRDWNASRDGRHYCLSAPGVGIAVANPDPRPDEVESDDFDIVQGTSFAAPIVAGGLAIVTEAFRGQLTPAEIGRRLVDTANNRGKYGNHLIYGAGAMDLDAATRPIGSVSTGTAGGQAPLAITRFTAPAAWGDVGARVANVEFASFDQRNAPFWSRARGLFTRPSSGFFVPGFDVDAGMENAGVVLPHLRWADVPSGALAGLAPKGQPLELRMTASAAPASPGGESGRPWQSFGFSARPFSLPLRVGFVAETKTNQGTTPSGAFGQEARSQLVWLSQEHRWPIGERGDFGIEADWLMAAGNADYPSEAMFDPGNAVYTAGALALTRRHETSVTRLALSLPLRAEAGRGRFTFPVGRTRDGVRLYDTREVSLAPDARETRLSLRSEHAVGTGDLVVEVGHARDAGHVPGIDHTFAGAAYRVRW